MRISFFPVYPAYARNLQIKMAAVSSVCLPEIKRDLLFAVKECSDRGLLHSAKW